jgi:hypothetical protein
MVEQGAGRGREQRRAEALRAPRHTVEPDPKAETEVLMSCAIRLFM